MTTNTTPAEALPPMPHPIAHILIGDDSEDVFTTEQLHAFAESRAQAAVTAALASVPAPAVPAEVIDMALCERHSLVLRVGQPYVFRPVGDCESCAEMYRKAVEAYGPDAGEPAAIQSAPPQAVQQPLSEEQIEAQPEPVELTDEEIDKLWAEHERRAWGRSLISPTVFARAAIAAYQAKLGAQEGQQS